MLICNVKSKNYIKWCTTVLMQFVFHHSLYTEHHNYFFISWNEWKLQEKKKEKKEIIMLNAVCGLSIPVYTSDKQYVHVTFFPIKQKFF